MARKLNEREQKRRAKHRRIRKKISGTADRPRLCVHRSVKNLYAQIIDDAAGKVLCGMSTLNKELAATSRNGGNVEGAAALGAKFAKTAKDKGISRVSFDRGGYMYHGRVKAFADAARENGLEF